MQKQRRPRIRIGRGVIDWILESMGLTALILIIAYPLMSFGELPAEIPSHFDASGEPDAYSGKWIIWLLPLVTLILYSGMSVFQNYPHVFNYPVKVTNENAEKLYRTAVRSLTVLKVLVTLFFLYITIRTILIATGKATELGEMFLYIFIGAIVVTTGIMFFRMFRARR